MNEGELETFGQRARCEYNRMTNCIIFTSLDYSQNILDVHKYPASRGVVLHYWNKATVLPLLTNYHLWFHTLDG